jgi:hypothetical protein
VGERKREWSVVSDEEEVAMAACPPYVTRWLRTGSPAGGRARRWPDRQPPPRRFARRKSEGGLEEEERVETAGGGGGGHHVDVVLCGDVARPGASVRMGAS